MKKAIILAIAAMTFCGYGSYAATVNAIEAPSEMSKVVSRANVKLYYGDECLALYTNGSCVLTKSDSVRISGTYSIQDGWVVLEFEGNEVPCKATIRGGSVHSVSYNGCVYRAR